MRWLMWVAMAWVAGILAHGCVGGGAAVWATALVLCAAARRAGIIAVCCAGVAAGGLGAACQRGRTAVEWPAGEVVFDGEIARSGERALIDVTAGHETARVQVNGGGLPGDRVRFRSEAHAPRGYWNEGAFDRARFLAGRGVDAVVAVRAPGVVRVDAPEAVSAWRYAAAARERAAAALSAASMGDGEALLQALVLGRRVDLPPALNDDFRRAGVAHVLSVSGLHLAAVTWMLFAFVRRAWLAFPLLALRVPADRAAALVAMPAAAAYTLLTGAEVATVRSLVAALVVLSARVLLRRPDTLTALAAAALVILADSPLVIYEPSFQLSFSAAAALAVCPRVPGGRLRQALVASAAASLATAPFTALHFGVVQPAGVLTNLVVVPLAEMVVLPAGLLGALAGAIWQPLGAPLVAFAGLAASALARLVGFLGAWSPTFTVPPPRPVELILFGAGLWLVARRRFLVALAVVALSVGSCFSAPLRAGAEITFLDVGQGDAAVVALPEETWLIDAGGRLFGVAPDDDPLAGDPGEQAVWPFLRARRVRRLDLVVISHPHPDHYGGLMALLGHVEIGEVWINGDVSRDPAWNGLLARLGARVRRPGVGETRVVGGARLTVLAAPTGDDARHANDDSLVVRFDYAGRSVLFPGDVESDAEAAVAWPAVDVVKVPHHGSRTSSTPGFVLATRPAVAVVSCGAHNHFGFPAPSVVARWLAAGAAVWRTDVLGAVTVHIDDAGGVDDALFRAAVIALAHRLGRGHNQAMHEKIREGFQAFLEGNTEEFGAVRGVTAAGVVIYIENAGDYLIPLRAIASVTSQKVVFDPTELDKALLATISHAHDAEQPGL